MSQDKKTFIAFDQYQRYETISRLINFQRQLCEQGQLYLLEIGANIHKNMQVFLPQDEIVYTDIVLTDEMKQDPDFQQVDGTKMPFRNSCFDFVYAADVLEHILPSEREKFILEACRVVKDSVILSFPYYSADVIDAESRVNSYYKMLSGKDFVWLKEHSQCGLPYLDEIDEILSRNGLQFTRVFHGAVDTWEKMWYAHFATVFSPETLEYRTNIDHYYNMNLYESDVSDSCYRVFYIISQSGLKEVKQYIDSMWSPVQEKSLQFLDTILMQHQNAHQVCSNRSLQKLNMERETLDSNRFAQYEKQQQQNLDMLAQLKTVVQEYEAERHKFEAQLEAAAQELEDKKIYYEAQLDISAQEYKTVRRNYEARLQKIDYRLRISEHKYREQLQKLKQKQKSVLMYYETRQKENETIHQELLANYEERLAALKSEYETAAELKKQKYEKILAMKNTRFIKELSKQQHAFAQKMDQIQQRCSAVEKELESYQYHYSWAISQRDELTQQLTQSQAMYEQVQQHCGEIEQELGSYQYHYSWAISQRDELTLQLAHTQAMCEQAQYAYNVISNAFFWKITKPFRATLDAIKANRFVYLFWKGVRCWKENGISYTWRKLKNYGRNHAAFQQPEYVNVPVPAEVHEVQTTEPPVSEIQGDADSTPSLRFSILVPLYNTPKKYLCEMIESVICQTYKNWELCLADGSTESYVEEICQKYVQGDSRIRYMKLEANLGISNNTNRCADMASGDYFVLLDHDDLLMPDALLENEKAIQETKAEVLYSDEDQLSLLNKHINPFFKPDWSPDLLYSQMYICHLLVFHKEFFYKLGGFRSGFDGSQDYDFMLRLSEHTNRICHIPKILYTWRQSENSTAVNPDAKPCAHIVGKQALDEHLKRKYGISAYAEDANYTFVYNPRFEFSYQMLVSIIIPMKDKWELTNACIESILEKSRYQNIEILILDNRSRERSTVRWMKSIVQKDSRIHVITADMEFNWSKLNNFGVSNAKGDVFIFLNNDTLVISGDWIERLSENACRDEIGVVGGLLLYPDETIQHAGVVVGMGGWADHVFKGMDTTHFRSPFVSPMVSRNVLAVTGACMAVSRKAWEKIGSFDEEFVICGSDVEYCIRAYEKGFYNRYDANVRLYHLESKSRDSYIPEIDFQKSANAYAPYRDNVDPYFNINLDIDSVVPKEKVIDMNLMNFKNFLKRSQLVTDIVHTVKRNLMPPVSYVIPEVGQIQPRECKTVFNSLRINLLIPSVDRSEVFGGISTALSFFEELRKASDFPARIIVTDASLRMETSVLSEEYCLVDRKDDPDTFLQLLSLNDRYGGSFPVSENDIFIATGWWTAYVIADVLKWQKTFYGKLQPLIYLVQDYEPGFYPWSSRYLMADSTYHLDVPVFAVINSSILKDFFEQGGYHFEHTWYFEPKLNESLKKFLPKKEQFIPKKKQILVYGRPSVARNAFELLVYALKLWSGLQPDAREWTVVSAGEAHDDVDIGNGMVLHSVGKMTLEEYASTMLDTYAGISLMVSPHPSYPPLEMAAFGVRTITNCYANKDLSTFNDNIISLRSSAPRDIAEALCAICEEYSGLGRIALESEYIQKGEQFGNVVPELLAELEGFESKVQI